MRNAGGGQVADNGTPDDGTHDNGTHDNGTRDNGTPDDGLPGDGLPGDAAPGDETPGEAAPGDATPDDGTPHGETPESEGGRSGEQYQVLGFVFALLGLVLLLGTDSRSAGLPFLTVGIVFLVMSRQGGKRPPPAPGHE